MSNKLARILFYAVLLCSMLISGTAIAGTDVDTTKHISPLPEIETIIYLSSGTDNQIADAGLEKNNNVKCVDNFETLLKAFGENPNAAIIVDKNAVSLIDIKAFKELMAQYKPVILVGYADITNAVKIAERKAPQLEGADSVRSNGFCAVVLERGAIVQAGAYTINRSIDKLTGFINRVNQYIIDAGYYQENESQDELALPSAESDQSESSLPARESNTIESAGNHLIKFYDSTSTTLNKVYSTRVESSSYIVSNLYRGEAVMDMESSSTTTSGGTTYYWNTVEYYSNSSSSYQTGYMLSETHAGGEVFYRGFLWCSTLDSFVDDHVSGAPDYVAERSVSGTFYYGIKARAASALYNSSGTQIRTTSSGNWLWVTGSNRCGSSNHHYMTIQGYSTSKTGTITDYSSSTTFFNAKFNNANPDNYAIWSRLP